MRETEPLLPAPALAVEGHSQGGKLERRPGMIRILKQLLTNPAHDEYMCTRRNCATCELQDTGHFEALKEMNEYPILTDGSQED